MEVVLPPDLKGALGAALKGVPVRKHKDLKEADTDKPTEPRNQKHEIDLNKVEERPENEHGVPEAVDATKPKIAEVFAAGEQVQYWSETHKIWVDSEVEEVLLVEGAVRAYRLSSKSNAHPARVRRPPAKKPETTGGAAGDASTPCAPMAAGDMAQYWSDTQQCWLEAVVLIVRSESQGLGLVYDLSCKRGVPPARVRPSPSRMRPGMRVEYWSVTTGNWVPARLLRVNGSQGTCDLDVKRGAPLARTRRLVDATPAVAFNTKAAERDPAVVSPEFTGVLSPDFPEAGPAQPGTDSKKNAVGEDLKGVEGSLKKAEKNEGGHRGHACQHETSCAERKRERREGLAKELSADGPDRRSPNTKKKAARTRGRTSSSSVSQRRSRGGKRRSRSAGRQNDRSERSKKSEKHEGSPPTKNGGKLGTKISGVERDKPSSPKQKVRRKGKRGARGTERQRRRSQSQASESRGAKRKHGKRKRSEDPKRVRLVPNSHNRA